MTIPPDQIRTALEAASLSLPIEFDVVPAKMLDHLADAVMEAIKDHQSQQLVALRTRLAAAENVCAMLAWDAPPAVDDDAHKRATWLLWSGWSRLPGVSIDRADYPHLTDEIIAGLARRDHREQATRVPAEVPA